MNSIPQSWGGTLSVALIVIVQARQIGILAPEAWKIEGNRSPPQLSGIHHHNCDGNFPRTSN